MHRPSYEPNNDISSDARLPRTRTTLSSTDHENKPSPERYRSRVDQLAPMAATDPSGWPDELRMASRPLAPTRDESSDSEALAEQLLPRTSALATERAYHDPLTEANSATAGA
jgi:hypothetical protein